MALAPSCGVVVLTANAWAACDVGLNAAANDDSGLVMREGQRVPGLALPAEVYATPMPTGARRWVGAQG